MKKLNSILLLTLITAGCNGGSNISGTSGAPATQKPTPAQAVATAQVGGTYTTSTGAVFTQVEGPSGPGGSFGLAWKDPSGAIWSSYQGDYANNAIQPDQPDQANQGWQVIVNSAATEACEKIGGSLPTTFQYDKLLSYFELDHVHFLTPRGQKDWFALFPDMPDRCFWSSSVVTWGQGAGRVELFSGDESIGEAGENNGNGESCNYDTRSDKLPIRCVAADSQP